MRRVLLTLTLAALAVSGTVSAISMSSRDIREHQIHFEQTDHELHIYRIYGKSEGPTVLIIGGIHGDEPGGYLAADKYVDLELLRGNLIVVPRANLKSIFTDDRGQSGDYNRKFGSPNNGSDYADKVVNIIKELIQESDLVLNLHDGSGFYRDKWLDNAHNPFRFGQSVIADCETYVDNETGKMIDLGDIGRRVVNRANTRITEHKYHFTFANHNSVDPDTMYPDMRKTVTYYALTQHNIPAFGVETSKMLPDNEMRVEHQLYIINAFLDEMGVVIDMPGGQVVKPTVDYVVIAVNEKDRFVVTDGEALQVAMGDSIRVDHIVGNYDRHLYADIIGVEGLNDNGKSVKVTSNLKIRVRKDSTICGEITVEPVREMADQAVTNQHMTNLTTFVVEHNNEMIMVPSQMRFKVAKGDTIKILDYTRPGGNTEGINVNFVGFVGNPESNVGEDRGFVINVDTDLMPRWSTDGRGVLYRVSAKRRSDEIDYFTVEVISPQMDYLVLQRNEERPQVVVPGDVLESGPGEGLKILGIQANFPDNQVRYTLFDARGRKMIVEKNTKMTIDATFEFPLILKINRGEREVLGIQVKERIDHVVGRDGEVKRPGESGDK